MGATITSDPFNYHTNIGKVRMKIQASCKNRKLCVNCDSTIQRSESRKVDGCMHSHLDCGDNIKKPLKSKVGFWQRFRIRRMK